MEKEIDEIMKNSAINCDSLEEFTHGETGNSATIRLLCILGHNKDVFEFGTFQGRTTSQIARCANTVTTIDLGMNTSDDGYPDYEVGKYSKNLPNVTQLIGNSLTFDFKPYYGKFDVIYVDGGHSYEVCKSDFMNSIYMLKREGWIIIDDPDWPGVSSAMQEVSFIYPIYRAGTINIYRR
jgi:predicted O-methyltransferase YrrM